MNVIEDLLNKEHDSDVYYLNNLIPFEDSSRLAKQRGFLSFHINGRTIKSRQEFLNVISTVMEFPYFGNNWDALLDCLRDLSWFSTNGYILLFGDFQCFAKSDQKAFSLALEILKDATEFWKTVMKNSPPMYILLQGDKALVPDIQVL